MKKIQTVIIALFLAIGIQPLFAQPATPAPEPTHDGSDVVSTFSNYYSQTGKGVEPQSWGGNGVTKATIAGFNDDVLFTNGASAVVYTSGWSAQAKGYIHIDVYSVGGGSFSFGVGDGFGGETVKWLSAGAFTWPSIPAGVWTGVDVPVVEFVKAGLNDAVNVQSLKFSGSGNYYLDNIYAYGAKQTYEETAILAIAPVPAHAASDVKSVFSDSYTAATKGFTPQTFGGVLAKIMKYGSDQSQSVVRMLGIGTSLATIDTWRLADKPTIHVDVYWDGTGDGSFSFGLASRSWDGNQIKYNDNYPWPATRQGQWVGFDIPTAVFAEAGVEIDQITQIKFKGSGNFYIDNLYAYSSDVTLDADATLKALTVSEGALTPAFSANTATYSVEVPETVTSITLAAEANSSKALSVTGTGEKTLNPGNNVFPIVVTAESGATKTYTVTVIKTGGQGIALVNGKALKVASANGVLQVAFEGKASVKLYSVSGQLLDQTPAVNQYTKSLSQGIYILNVDGKAQKVLVK
ncbi:hypothetical protein FACS189413_06140 [Bacteroidia bacterium]|nr:hypothetical protein FACS189413_06140 [Bacteroidia bacterium]